MELVPAERQVNSCGAVLLFVVTDIDPAPTDKVLCDEKNGLVQPAPIEIFFAPVVHVIMIM